jgi:hypothetical protein
MVRLVPAWANVATMGSALREQDVMQTLKAGVLYFVLVFGTGFVFGTIRMLRVVPRGTGMAGDDGTPFMLSSHHIAARWTIHVSLCRPHRLPGLAGFVALGLLLAASLGSCSGSGVCRSRLLLPDPCRNRLHVMRCLPSCDSWSGDIAI